MSVFARFLERYLLLREGVVWYNTFIKVKKIKNMKKIILSFFIALFVIGSIPILSFASTEQQVPVGALAQLLAAIQTLVEKVGDLQKVIDKAGSTPANMETSSNVPSSGVIQSSSITNNQSDQLLSACCACHEWVMGAPGNIVSTGACSTLTCQPGYMKEFAPQSLCFANGGTPSNSLINGTNNQGTKNNQKQNDTSYQAGISYITIAKDANAPLSNVILAGQNGVELHKIRFVASGNDLTLKKITLQLVRANKRLWAIGDVAANFSTISLYDGSTLVGQGIMNSNGLAIFSGMNVVLPKDTQKVLTVKTNISSSGTLKENSTLALQIYSTKPNDLEIYDANGLINPKSISLLNNAESNFNLYKSVTPGVANMLSNGTKIGQFNDVIGKYNITNTTPSGGRALSLSNLNVRVVLGGSYSPQSTVTNFKLYDESDTLIATGVSKIILTGSNPSVVVKFSIAPGFVQEIGAGTSKTYTVKADTTGIRNYVPSGSNVSLTTKIEGTRGYSSSDLTGPEYYWGSGDIAYQYITGTYGAKIGGNTASNSYEVNGATFTY